jgi:hypothetical protein
LLFLITSLKLNAQIPGYPKGVYANISELRDKQPSIQHAVIIEKRTISDIRMNGGNDYKIISKDGSIKNSVFKKEVFAYSTGDSLFLNGFSLKIQPWFTLMLKMHNNDLIFSAAISNSDAGAYAFMGGAIGGAMAATKRHLYTLDLSSGKLQRMCITKMNSLLSDRPLLKEKYNLEVDKAEDETFLKYINQL